MACGKDNSTGPGVQTFVADLNSANEPSLKAPSQATGTATFTVSGGRITLTSLVVQNMDSVTASHIHLGAAGVAGGIAVPLLALNPPSGHIGAGQTLVSSLPITAATVVGISGAPPISLDSLLVLFNNAGAYVNVHTRANPAGEIRGQLVRQ
jgi:hypothetical protein